MAPRGHVDGLRAQGGGSRFLDCYLFLSTQAGPGLEVLECSECDGESRDSPPGLRDTERLRPPEEVLLVHCKCQASSHAADLTVSRWGPSSSKTEQLVPHTGGREESREIHWRE